MIKMHDSFNEINIFFAIIIIVFTVTFDTFYKKNLIN